MKLACLDAFSGASGDMILGALVDAGCPPQGIRRALSPLRLPPWRFRASRVMRGGFTATRVEVIPGARARWAGVRGMASRNAGRPGWRGKGAAILASILRAEGRVHGTRAEHAHLHELEDLDTVVDVFGSLAALDILGIGKVHVMNLSAGSGTVSVAHGHLPVPAPGTAELLKGRVVRLGSGTGELLTPTGAAIIAGIAVDGPPPAFRVQGIGYGAGSRDTHGSPNVLRVFVGEAVAGPAGSGEGGVVQLDAVIDDMNPQLVEPFLERVYGAGALEAWAAPVYMKRNRPGFSLTVLCREPDAAGMTEAFLEETTTLGVRITRPERTVLGRRMDAVRTAWGTVRVKVAGNGRSLHVTPEFGDVAKLARRAGIPARLVLEEARARAALKAGLRAPRGGKKGRKA
jgi:hypothetical protein